MRSHVAAAVRKAGHLAACVLAAAGLAATAAVSAATGDLDPSFVFVQPATGGVQGANVVAWPGGGWLTLRSFLETASTTRLELRRVDADGALVPSFGSAGVVTTTLPYRADLTFAIARLADGRLLLGGWADPSGQKRLAAVLRLDAAGRVDATFGAAGDGLLTQDIAALDDAAVGGIRVLPDGALLIAANGRNGDIADLASCPPIQSQLIRASADGRSIDVAQSWQTGYPSCRVAGLYAIGANDSAYDSGGGWLRVDAEGRRSTAFGDGGPFAGAPPVEYTVDTLVTDPSGTVSVVFGGFTGSFLSRYDGAGVELAPRRSPADPYPVGLLANAYPDQSFASHAINLPALLLARDASGPRWYAGFGVDAARDRDGVWGTQTVYAGVVRFREDGSVDTGWHGIGVVGFPPASGPSPAAAVVRAVRYLAVQDDGRVVVALHDGRMYRLLGGSDAARGGIGIERNLYTAEGDLDMTIRVSRTGGSTGAVSVDFAVTEVPASFDARARARAGIDFVAHSGRLDWADGESGDHRITVRIRGDDVAEIEEYFRVTLSNSTGGARIFAPDYADYAIQQSTGSQQPEATPANTGSGGGGALGAPGLAALALLAAGVEVRRRRSLTPLRRAPSLRGSCGSFPRSTPGLPR